MKVVLAIDSYKGCLSSTQVEQEVADALRLHWPDVCIDQIPIADGGEGTLQVIAQMLGADPVLCMACNPCMEPVSAQYAVVPQSETAIIEMAAVSGLPLIEAHRRNPLLTTTYGTGQLIADALHRGCRHFIIGIGGSATNDCGVGMLQALGYRFFDADCRLLHQGGEVLGRIASWDDSSVPPELKQCRFTVACDVSNPLYGPLGGAYVFAPQKGADDTMVKQLDAGMRHFSQVVCRVLNIDISGIPGSGAAGGMGGGMIAFLGARLISGADLVLQLSHFEERISDAHLVITGEGRMDEQTLMGKIPGKILHLAQLRHIPVVGLAGKVVDESRLLSAGFSQLVGITPPDMPLHRALMPDVARCNIRAAIACLCRSLFDIRHL